MIHAVFAANQHLYAQQLQDMFRQREALARSGADELDDGGVVYLMRLEADGRLVESARLNPARGNEDAWEVTLWPPNPSEELVESIREFCEA